MGLTLLVTGAGGPAGVSVIRALVSRGHRVIGADADPAAVGIRLADESVALPRADHPHFAARVLLEAHERGAQVVISTVAEELEVLSAYADARAEQPFGTWLPSHQAIVDCNDKWRFAQRLRAAGVPTPATALAERADVPGPWVVKPRRGRGSRGVRFAETRDELARALADTTDAIVQTRCAGREFTADVLVSRDGRLVGCVPRWRIETKAGISTKGETFRDERVARTVAAALAAIELDGPANVQGFVADGGEVTIVEINPRFSGGLPLSLAAGADLVGEYVRGALGEEPREEYLSYRSGVRMYRYYEELFEENE